MAALFADTIGRNARKGQALLKLYTTVARSCNILPLCFIFIDVFPKDQLYILYSAENSGVQLGSYVVSECSIWLHVDTIGGHL